MSFRPQEPVPPFPYAAKEVTFKSGTLDIAATLTLPLCVSPHPAVVLVHGSAAHTRNAELNEHKPFRLLSDYLTRRGFAVLCYDKRGNGNSSGDFSTATTLDLARDAASAVEFLQQHPTIDAKRISIVGHSEGGMIASWVASRSQAVSAIAMLAAPCVPGDQLMLTQTETVNRKFFGMPEEQLAQLLQLDRQIYTIAKSEAIDAEDKIIALIAPQNPIQQEAARAKAKSWTTPWDRFFLGYDPRPTLSQVRCPVLALYAEKDTQVISCESIAEIRKVLSGRTNVEVLEIAGVNHYFQTCWTGLRDEYQLLEETIAMPVLAKIASFLEAITTH